MAISRTIKGTGRGVAGSAFLADGMNSADDPMFISDRSYRSAMNVLNRGGVVRTRPGFRSVAVLPLGKVQGLYYFRPMNATPFLIVAVGGRLYRTQYPFNSFDPLSSDLLFHPNSDFVYGTVATRSAQRAADGTVEVIEPYRMLVLQDGFSKPVLWDGETFAQANPANSETPVGGPVKWSGDRLWVARDNRLYASDISDPKSFVENEYAAEGGFFLFPDRIVALEELPSFDNAAMLVFTEYAVYLLQTGIRDRSTWKTTKDFQQMLVPGVGCIAPRSVVPQLGTVWWLTQDGITNLDAAKQARISSRLTPVDTAMAVSKFNLAPRWSKSAGAAFENLLLMSLPYADWRNTHTWVLDQSVNGAIGEASRAWASYWTGVTPVQWAGGIFGGVPRLFCVSTTEDGENVLWESFDGSRTDDAGPVTAFIETKTHIDFSEAATGLDRKRFVYAELHFEDIVGDLSVNVYWAGTRGGYKLLSTHTFKAGVGDPNYAEDLQTLVPMRSSQPQSRVFRTPEVRQTSATTCSVCGVESALSDWIDVGFSLVVSWSGHAALRSYRIFADPWEEPATGATPAAETESTVVPGGLCTP